MITWDGIKQPAYIWMNDYWYKLDTKEIFLACENGWRHKTGLVIPYADYVTIFD